MDYQKMYTTLFNAITDALSQIQRNTYLCPAKSRRNLYHSTKLKKEHPDAASAAMPLWQATAKQ